MIHLYCPQPLYVGQECELPAETSRHVQVLRMQPGQGLHLFTGEGQDGRAGYFVATITRMTRHHAVASIQHWQPVDLPAEPGISLAVGVPANERMDWLVEKATELGVQRIQPLISRRSVWRSQGDGRAEKKCQHWQAVAIAACEQSGRLRIPHIAPVQELSAWLGDATLGDATRRWCLSLRPDAPALRQTLPLLAGDTAWLLSGPEGGLEEAEEELAYSRGFAPVSLGPYTLRADTAPISALSCLMLR